MTWRWVCPAVVNHLLESSSGNMNKVGTFQLASSSSGMRWVLRCRRRISGELEHWCRLHHMWGEPQLDGWRGVLEGKVMKRRCGQSEASMEQRLNARVEEKGEPRENLPTSGDVRHDSHVQNRWGNPNRESSPARLWWEASALPAEPPRGTLSNSEEERPTRMDAVNAVIYGTATLGLGKTICPPTLQNSTNYESGSIPTVSHSRYPQVGNVVFVNNRRWVFSGFYHFTPTNCIM
ncbi:hypothetical protein PR048_007851 [Dryococelus australis]|uniref:Uncharacterized protein n=1 Tax=Dryococelus australis TaxID=614101 RepID=A0ABQ9HVF4_9NEOP|nr:hypothetical protein PR048_007851 [Dryococelus australis]